MPDTKAPERRRYHALELSLMLFLRVNSGTGPAEHLDALASAVKQAMCESEASDIARMLYVAR